MKKLTEIPEWVALERAVSILGLGGAFDNQKRANKALAAAGTAIEAALSGDTYTAPVYSEAHDIARLAPAAAAGSIAILHYNEQDYSITLPPHFAIGPDNTYHQAWLATLSGHQVRLPDWPSGQSWIFERTHQELLRVYGDTLGEWQLSGVVVCPTGAHQLSEKWIVLPIIDTEPPTV